MTTKESQDKLKEPFSAYGSYSYADYISWQVDGMVELIKGNNQKNLQQKYDVYEENGVIIHPDEQTLVVYTLRDERFVPSKLFTVGEKVASSCLIFA